MLLAPFVGGFVQTGEPEVTPADPIRATYFRLPTSQEVASMDRFIGQAPV